jgi:hypothetical protein
MVANLSWADILGVLDELPMLEEICKFGRSCVYSAYAPRRQMVDWHVNVDVIRKSFGPGGSFLGNSFGSLLPVLLGGAGSGQVNHLGYHLVSASLSEITSKRDA